MRHIHPTSRPSCASFVSPHLEDQLTEMIVRELLARLFGALPFGKRIAEGR